MDSADRIVRTARCLDNLKMSFFVCCRLTGCELFDYITEKDFLEEQEAVSYIRNILQAVKYLHDNQVCHLDIKVF